MKKRMLALLLVGALISSSAMSVCAADLEATSEANAVVSEETADEAVEAPDTVLPEEEEAPEEEIGEAQEEETGETDESGQPGTETPDTNAGDTAEESETVDDTSEGFTGWKDNQYYVDGAVISGQIYEIDGVWYAFDADGYLVVNSEYELWDEEGQICYYRASEDGSLISGWYFDEQGTKYYYFPEDYKKSVNVVFEVDGTLYNADWDGSIITDTRIFYDGNWYWADGEGAMTLQTAPQTSGWVQEYGEWYYYVDGKMIYDQIYEVGGQNYYFDSIGRMVVGSFWYMDSEAGYARLKLADSDGHVIEDELGWMEVEGLWYYFTEYGWIYSDGFMEIADDTYYFDYSGVMFVGVFDRWDPVSGTMKVYCADKSGKVTELPAEPGWIPVPGSSEWCYMKDDGMMAQYEFLMIGGKLYYFDGYVMKTGLFEAWNDDTQTSELYYANASGAIQKKQWIPNSDKWYYAEADGSLCRNGVKTIDGVKYFFDYSGIMQTGIIYYWDYENSINELYYANPKGVIQSSQWVTDNGYWYYAGADGKLYSGEIKTIGSKKYMFDYSGRVVIGVAWLDSNAWLTDESGAIIEKKGWRKRDLEWYYILDNGKLAINQWVESDYYVGYDGAMCVGTQEIDGTHYFFDSNGVCKGKKGIFTGKGWSSLIDGHYYYNDQNGNPYTGWVDDEYYVENGVMRTNLLIREKSQPFYYVRYDGKYIRNTWYFDEGYGWIYADKNGRLAKDEWKTINNKKYYFSGISMVIGTRSIDGVVCEFDSNGVYIEKEKDGKYRGWVNSGGAWRYYDSTGELFGDGFKTIDGTKYYFQWGFMAEDRILQDEKGKAIYADGSGAIKTPTKGWNKLFGTWYYVDADGTWAEDVRKIGGKWYYFSYGRMCKGYIYISEWNGSYFFDESGAWKTVKTGWYNADGWYYFEDGNPARGLRIIGGKYYEFVDGAMITGPSGCRLFGESGALLKNSWYKSEWNGRWYYADSNGRFVKGEQTINGTKYYFDEGGRMVK